ncbi:MAG: SMI1/KNR4 family protein [Planctomycetaceae bacterium]|nr:SMI1/KNR4 family protein [Planctomycetaceae bacterium]
MPEKLQYLKNLMPPPNIPIPKVDWNSLEQELGTSLPDDYKRFCDVYGPGSINGHIWINHPSVLRPGVTLREAWLRIRERLREYAAMNDAYEPPEDPALSNADLFLPCGGSDNGHIFFG